MALKCQSRFATDFPLKLIGDPERIRQILVNVLGNSHKFTNAGNIDLFVSKEREAQDGKIHLRFEVRDTGIGLPDENTEQ